MPVNLEQKLKFRDSTKNVFKKISEIYSISPRIALMQSAHESNWGISELATQGMNIYGMTPGQSWLSWKRGLSTIESVPKWTILENGLATVNFLTKEDSKRPPHQIRWWDFPGDIDSKKDDGKGGSICVVRRHFRKYYSWEESAFDWARKISRGVLYAKTYNQARIGDPFQYAEEISDAGYATDEKYAEKLISVLKEIDALPGSLA